MRDFAITVIGAGSWGTALAMLLARNGIPTKIWSNVPEELAAMQADRANHKYLPNIPFPEKLIVCQDLASAMQDANDILIVVPSHAFRQVLIDLAPYYHSKTRIAWATKGIDPNTEQLLHQVALDTLPVAYPLAVLSGPSFALEVAKGKPTAINVAATEKSFTDDLIAMCHSDNFRLDPCDDLIGVQLCGAVKNVLAIAVGLTDGLDYGPNAQSALIALGLAEMRYFGLTQGAQLDTFNSLAGVGDLILTCSDNQSRNRRFGLALGQGQTREQAEMAIGQVVEGAKNARQVHRLAERAAVSMPICRQVYRILYEAEPATSIIKPLIGG